MPAGDNHNEWFRPVACGGRKSCPNCKAKLRKNESIWSWGNYVRVSWRTVSLFCRDCFRETVADPLLDHAGDCGCSITLVMYQGADRPKWLKLPKRRRVCKIKQVATPTTFDEAMAIVRPIVQAVPSLADAMALAVVQSVLHP